MYSWEPSNPITQKSNKQATLIARPIGGLSNIKRSIATKPQ